MTAEMAYIDRVDTYVRHPVFRGSDEVMERVLEDLESVTAAGRLRPETFAELRDKILRSPHFGRHN